jgi:hypothetical protein
MNPRFCCRLRASLFLIVCIVIAVNCGSAQPSIPNENYDCEADRRRLTNGMGQAAAYDLRRAAGGLIPDTNPGYTGGPYQEKTFGSRGTVGSVIPQAVDYSLIGNRNKDVLFHLRSNIEIPDDGEISPQIFVPDDIIVKTIEVNIRGLYHEHAEDLKIRLQHVVEEHSEPDVSNSSMYDPAVRKEQTKSLESQTYAECLLVNQRQGGKFYGTPDAHPHPNRPSVVPGVNYPEPNRVRGVGYNYIFNDIDGNNLAFNKTTKQSSTKFGGVSSRAVDGITNGHYAQHSVTHTAGHKTHQVTPGNPYHDSDPQAWWQVDLGSSQTIGSMRVWNRIQETNIDEVQRIRTHSAGVLSGTFKLSFNFSGVVETTGPIRHDAVAMIRDEVKNSTGGNGPGESLQAKIQGLNNINVVSVARVPYVSLTAPADVKAYEWAITFVSEPGDLEEMKVASNGLTSEGSSISVHTVRDGNSNVWYNYKYGMSYIQGRLTPSWIMVLNEDVDDTNYTYARSKAVWERRIDVDARETGFHLPSGISGRYVRVQLESSAKDAFLSIAELQVYPHQTNEVRYYRGGSPVAAGTYSSEESLTENFGGIRARGIWILSIRDMVQRRVVNTQDSRPSYGVHGRGAIDDWTLTITDTNGTKRIYHMDISAVVKTLPTYGRLFIYNEEWKARGREIGFVKGQGQHLGQCYGNCKDKHYGVGNRLSTLIAGSMADINVIPKNRLVVYAPNRDYLGQDTFSYTVYIGSQESVSTGAVTMSTRVCRMHDCMNEAFEDGMFYLQNLWYRKEHEQLLSQQRGVRQAELLRTMRPSGSRL